MAVVRVFLSAICLVPAALVAQVNVTTFNNDNARTGQNTRETVLTPSNVKSGQFGKLFSTPVDGYVYAQPLYVANVQNIAGGNHNVLYIATEHASVYAMDADSGAVLWQQSLINPSAGITTVTSADVGCGDLIPEIGITSTPVIDISTGTIYLVAKTKEKGTYHQRLHALDIVSHVEKFGGPKEITATVQGRPFSPLWQHNRPGLLLENGHVVVAWASHCDNTPYEGWVIAYNATTLTQEAAFNTEADPNGFDGGIWMSGDGVAADSSGNLFFATGNGDYNSSLGDYGDSIMKLSGPSGGAFTIVDWFTPTNQLTLSNDDTDLGSGGVLLLPDLPAGSAHQQLLVQMGKEGKIYLIDRNSMGKLCSTCTTMDTQIVQELPNASTGIWGPPAYWNGNVYWGGGNDGGASDFITAWSFNANNSGLLSTSPTSASSNSFSFSTAAPVISANGTSNGILWILDNSSFGSTCCQILYAYDATNLSKMLYNSNQASGKRDVPGRAVKFTAPTVANGKVYVGSQASVSGFGLISTTPTAATPTFRPAPGSYVTSVNVTLSDTTPGAALHCTTDGSPPTSSSPVCSAITITATTTLQAIAVATGYNNSQVTSGLYNIVTSGSGISFGTGFSSSGLTLNGSATLNGTRLRLTDGADNEAGSAFYNSLVSVTSFTTDFSFQLTSPAADGITFTLQGVGSTALGPAGGGLGYGPDALGGTGGIGHSVAVKFDLYGNNGEGTDSTGLYTGGGSPTTPALDMTSSGVNLHDGDVFNVHITYDGSTLSMTITDASNSSLKFSASWPINIASTVGGNLAYAGFTGGTGGSAAIQEILNWTYVTSTGSSSPAATVKPLSMGLGSVDLGSTSPAHTVTLTNSSASGTLLISSIVTSGNFGQSNTCALSLAPNSSCVITVSFTPSGLGAISGVLSIYDNAANSPQMVTLSGQAILPLLVTPATLNFGTFTVGTTSAPLTATVKNNTTSAVSLSYNSSAGFVAVAAAGNGCGSTLAGQSSCNLVLSFSPLQNGNIWGSLAVSGASFPTQRVNLTGSGSGGPPGTLSFSPASLNLGNQVTAASTAPKTVAVTNKGASAVILNSLAASTGYSVTPSGASPCGGSLAAGGNCTFSVTFAPVATGIIRGAISIVNTGAINPLIYDLTGMGVPPVTFSVSSLTFAGQTAGTTSTPQTITLLNNQAAPLNLTSITASADYMVAPGGATPCGASVPANSKCTLQVTFTPTQTGTVKGVVTVTHNAAGSPQNVLLTGTGQ
jgi:hypothetical protein